MPIHDAELKAASSHYWSPTSCFWQAHQTTIGHRAEWIHRGWSPFRVHVLSPFATYQHTLFHHSNCIGQSLKRKRYEHKYNQMQKEKRSKTSLTMVLSLLPFSGVYTTIDECVFAFPWMMSLHEFSFIPRTIGPFIFAKNTTAPYQCGIVKRGPVTKGPVRK